MYILHLSKSLPFLHPLPSSYPPISFIHHPLFSHHLPLSYLLSHSVPYHLPNHSNILLFQTFSILIFLFPLLTSPPFHFSSPLFFLLPPSSLNHPPSTLQSQSFLLISPDILLHSSSITIICSLYFTFYYLSSTYAIHLPSSTTNPPLSAIHYIYFTFHYLSSNIHYPSLNIQLPLSTTHRISSSTFSCSFFHPLFPKMHSSLLTILYPLSTIHYRLSFFILSFFILLKNCTKFKRGRFTMCSTIICRQKKYSWYVCRIFYYQTFYLHYKKFITKKLKVLFAAPKKTDKMQKIKNINDL